MIDMKIDQYHITSNRYGVDVTKMKMVNGQPALTDKGIIIETSVGHYGSLENALKGLQAFIIRTGDTTIQNLDDFCKLNREIEAEFDEYLKNNGVSDDGAV